MFVVVGNNRVNVDVSFALTSSDGKTWTQRVMPSLSSGDVWVKVVYGGDKFVAVSRYGVTAVSSVGTSWTQWVGLPPGVGNVVGMAYGGGKFVAVTDNSVFLTKDDLGSTWNQGSLPYQFSTTPRIAYGNGVFAVLGRSNSISRCARSVDGINWTQGFISLSPFDGVLEDWSDVAYGDGLFVAVAPDIMFFLTSSDGLNWGYIPLPEGLGAWASDAALVPSWNGIVYGNELFMAVAYENIIVLKTADQGETWSHGELPVSGNRGRISYEWKDIAYGGNTFVTISDGSIFVSSRAGGWRDIQGATSSSLALTGLDISNNGDLYRVIVSSSSDSVTSLSAQLTVFS